MCELFRQGQCNAKISNDDIAITNDLITETFKLYQHAYGWYLITKHMGFCEMTRLRRVSNVHVLDGTTTLEWKILKKNIGLCEPVSGLWLPQNMNNKLEMDWYDLEFEYEFWNAHTQTTLPIEVSFDSDGKIHYNFDTHTRFYCN